jgi:hypothetical protein
MSTNPAQNAEPFVADVAYIVAEGALLLARADRMEIERRLADAQEDGRRDTVGRRKSTHSTELDRQWTTAVETEERARTHVERLTAIPSLGINILAEKYGLNDLEKCVLTHCVLAALDNKYETAMGTIGHGSFASDPSPETIWRYLDMDPAARIASRVAFAPSSALLKHGLITMTWGRSATPADLRCALLQVRQRAFNLILGQPVDESLDDRVDPDGP